MKRRMDIYVPDYWQVVTVKLVHFLRGSHRSSRAVKDILEATPEPRTVDLSNQPKK